MDEIAAYLIERDDHRKRNLWKIFHQVIPQNGMKRRKKPVENRMKKKKKAKEPRVLSKEKMISARWAFQLQRIASPKKEEGHMAFDIQEELKKLPGKPGVYLMHDADDTIIYVGKSDFAEKPCPPVFSAQP